MSGSQLLLLGGVPAAVPVDPYFYSVTSLLHGDGTNGGQNNTFLDSSTNNFTITRNGNTTQGSFSPFSQTGWSNYFDGSGDYLSGPTNNAVSTFTGDFTIESWCYFNSIAADNTIAVCMDAAAGEVGWIFRWKQTATQGFRLFSSAIGTFDFAYVPSIGQWFHVAISRSGTSLRCFVNGTQIGTTQTASGTIVRSSVNPLCVGGGPYQAPSTNGYLSNVRIVNGTAVYTSDFTPSTTPLTAITNTSLLTCQSNRFIDNSSNAFTITRNGDVSVQPFSPFNPTTAYSTSSIGGSGYFDGSGDYLQSSITALSGQFTVEFWVYRPAAGNNFLFTIGDSSASSGAEIYIGSSGAQLNYYSSNAVRINGGTPPAAGQWNYFAVTRDASNDVRLYANGVQVGSSYNQSGTLSTDLRVGAEYYGGAITGTLNGYMGAFRISNTVRTVTTVPTSLWQSDANTVFLANFTNGAIFDNAAVADYETVGNAQISTSVKKYGTGSMSFDGTGDWLVAPASPSWDFGSGDFTVELWVNPSVITVAEALVSKGNASSVGNEVWTLQWYGTNQLAFFSGGGLGTPVVTTGSVFATGNWYHVAVCRTAGVTKIFVNGTEQGTSTTSYTITAGGALYVGAGWYAPASRDISGYIDDLRISKGVARYPYSFTPPTAAFPDIGGTVTLTADPYYEYTTLLLPGNGTNGAQNNTFLDSSTNAFTITRNGNTTQGTFSPFSQTGWGAYFNGSTDYISVADSADFTMGSGDFTIQCWVYSTSNSGSDQYILGQVNSGGTAAATSFQLYKKATSNVAEAFVYAGGSKVATGTAQIPVGQWTHLAMVRDGGTLRLYVNGSQDGTNATLSTTAITDSAGSFSVGRTGDYNGLYFAGYVSNVSVVKGTCLFPSGTTFTPSTTPLSTSTSGQSVLLCQANRFIDTNTATTAKTVTVGSTSSIQAFSPFNPTASWSAATYGGSGYFDGSGDYLTAPDDAFWDLSAGTGSIELFVYPSAAPTNTPGLVGQCPTTANWGSYVYSDGRVAVGIQGTSELSAAAGSLIVAAWNHIVITRDNSTGRTRLFVNGVLKATGTGTYFNNSSAALHIGYFNNYAFNGYIADVRFCKGSIPTTYQTSSTTIDAEIFTPPSSPVTTSSQGATAADTELLLSYTNAGIYDATSKNDLETVGNAQISTTQSKFGGSSMYFDGTGDYLKLPSNIDLRMDSGDFTWECWIYMNSVAATYQGVIDTGTAGARSTGGLFYFATSTLYYYSNSSNIVSSASFPTGSWKHIAVTRFGSTVRLFVDGVQAGSSGTSSTNMTSPILYVGNTFDNYSLNGYIDDLRITKGIARYTSNFTPPTTAFLTL